MKYKRDWIQIYIRIFHVVLCSLFGRNLFLFQQKITIKLRAESDHVKTLCPAGKEAGEMKETEGQRPDKGEQCCLQSSQL